MADTMDSSKKIRIIHSPTETEPFVVLDKISGLPTAPLSEGEESALTFCMELFPEIRAVSGKKEIEYGLVHRIDTETSGLVLIATSQDFYDFVIKAQSQGNFQKWYRAEVDSVPNISQILEGFPSYFPAVASKKFTVQSKFRYFGLKNSQVRPVTAEAGKAALKKCGNKIYETEIDFDSEKKTAVCRISSGFRHQVRTHLALCGIPVKGDRLYNPNFREGENLCFCAFRLKFPKPEENGFFVFEI